MGQRARQNSITFHVLWHYGIAELMPKNCLLDLHNSSCCNQPHAIIVNYLNLTIRGVEVERLEVTYIIEEKNSSFRGNFVAKFLGK